MTTITESLRAARACIEQDRTSLADTGMRPDNTMEPDAAAGVAEYDSVLQQIDAALAGMTHHITDEQIGQIAEQVGLVGPASRVGECHAAAHRFARAVLALAAPAQQGEPFGFFRATAFGWEDCAEDDEGAIALYTALTAAPTPPAQPKCLTCNGHGLIGGHMQDGSGYGEGCPDCNPGPAVPEDVGSGLPSDPVAWRWFNSNGYPVGDWRRLRPGQRSEIESQVADAGGRIEYAYLQASPAVPESADSVAPVQLGELAKRNVYDAIRGAYDLGYNDARNARAVPGDSAPGYEGRSVEADHGCALLNSLNRRLRSATAQPAVPEDVARDAERYRWLRERMIGIDFDWSESGATALSFEMPDGCMYCGDCDRNIDAARAAEKGGTA